MMGFEGQWWDGRGKALTIGSKYISGQCEGDYSVGCIDPGGSVGVLLGLGMDRSDGSLRMALKPVDSDKDGDYRPRT
ncbi:hypothetical protein ABZ746_34305 [Streptomyces sp. NPDC020096]